MELYKEFYEVKNREEQAKKWCELAAKGYHGSDIYEFNYKDIHGKFHYQIYVFNDMEEE